MDESRVQRLATAIAVTMTIATAPRRAGDCRGTSANSVPRQASCVVRALLRSYRMDRAAAHGVLRDTAEVASLIALAGGWLRRSVNQLRSVERADRRDS